MDRLPNYGAPASKTSQLLLILLLIVAATIVTSYILFSIKPCSSTTTSQLSDHGSEE